MTAIKNVKRLITASVCSGPLLLSACSPVTQENYDKLGMGMKYAEVTEILGEPSECKELMQIKQCRWGETSKEGGASISVNFVGNNVVLFSSSGLE